MGRWEPGMLWEDVCAPPAVIGLNGAWPALLPGEESWGPWQRPPGRQHLSHPLTGAGQWPQLRVPLFLMRQAA